MMLIHEPVNSSVTYNTNINHGDTKAVHCKRDGLSMEMAVMEKGIKFSKNQWVIITGIKFP